MTRNLISKQQYFFLLLFTSTMMLASQYSFGQNFLDVNSEFLDQGNGFVQVNLEGGYDSDGIESELFRQFLKGGYIDREIRQASAPDISEFNRVGISYSSEINFSFPAKNLFNKDSLNLMLSIGQEQIIAGQYDHAFYTLLFEGNAPFNGDLARFENCKFENWQTRSAGIGLHNRKNGNIISLKFHQGLSRQRFSFESGQTQTSENGQLITADVSGNLFSNNFTEDPNNSNNGTGIGIDGRINVVNNAKVGSIFLGFRNIGIMFWPKSIQEIDLENSYSFEGVDLSDVFSPDFSSVEIGDIDSYLDVEKTTAENLELLPIDLRVDYWKNLNQKLTFNFGLSTKLIYNWRPELVASIFHKIKPNLHIGGGIKYGGFGKPNLNFATDIKIKDYWHANVNISYLSGWISNAGYGSHLRIGLTRVLNFKKGDS